MRPTSRPAPTGRRPRTGPRPAARPARSPARRLPRRPVETPAPTPEPVPEQARGRRWRRVGDVLLAVTFVLVLPVTVLEVMRSHPGGDDPPAGRLIVDRPLIPAALPSRGALVVSEVRRDGSIAVTHWVRSDDALGEVSLSAPAAGGPVRATDGRLVTASGAVLADDLTVGAEPLRVRVPGSATVVRATYVLHGVTDRSGSVDGRLLAEAVALDVDAPAELGPTVVVVAAPDGQVLNLACANARSGVDLLRPCGSPAGSGWRVRLPAASRDDRVTAQVDVS
jgi:hypothetical protein